MTEENKENCIFQQNYNIFGLDDKPCCYLYHKYCDEIDSCYFKRCKHLEQENKELKIYIESNKQQVEEAEMLVMDNDRLQQEVENLKDIIYYDVEKYRIALEEIREYCSRIERGEVIGTQDCLINSIKNIVNYTINEVKND
jgi:hypothetical protein